ncbi:FAM96B [Arthroderma uncinatum]|uniref:FAM96B n=1 Tax=Arthroderma uncinatum TaxID=74035 RepID=UPI00144ABE97|nr:FAM96B [Arthroderma uncinatum]KAF3482039.1 FAM96B [Arthroderma uncinatum]
MQNSNPTLLSAADLPSRQSASKPVGGSIFDQPLALPDPFEASESDSDGELMEEPIDEQEIFDLIATISDPEHPIPLGELAVVSLRDISITAALPRSPASPLRKVTVLITPTITHCSLATVIGLGVRVRLEQSLPPRFRVDVRIKDGTHSTADEVNKQLADKERVAAALENGTLMGVIQKMLETCR